MEFDGDSAGSIESFFGRLKSEPSPRNLSQIFEDDALPMQKESRNLRYQPGGHRAQRPPQPQPSPTTSPEASSERDSVAVVEKTPSRWSVAFAKIVNIYNDCRPVERMGLALTMLGENEAATMVLYKQKTQTISSTKLKPNGKTIHLQDNYVQFYDDNRKYWSLRFVYQVDEEEFVHTMTSHDWPLEQHSSSCDDEVELQQQQQQQHSARFEEEVEQQEQQHSARSDDDVEQQHSARSEDDVEQQHSARSEDDVEQAQQDTEQSSDQTEELLSDQNSEQWNKRIEQKQQKLKEQLRKQLMDELNEQQIERNERCRMMHRELNPEQLREQNREQMRKQNWEQSRENPAEHREPRRHTCDHHRLGRNNEEHQVAPPQPMPRSRKSEEEVIERGLAHRRWRRGCFMQPVPEPVPVEDFGCEQPMPRARNLAISEGELIEGDLERDLAHRRWLRNRERFQPVPEPVPVEDFGCEHMQPVREQIPEEDMIVTPVSIPIGSANSDTSMENHYCSSTAVVQLPERRSETTNTSSQLTKFVNTHMGPGEIAEMKMQNILDAMQRVSDDHRRNFCDNQDQGAPQPQPRPSKSEDAEERVLQLEQILLNAKKENMRLSKELKMRDADLLSFQKSSLILMEKLMTTNEELTAKNSRLVDTIMSHTTASKQKNCINCERSAQEIVNLKRHISALELALRAPE